jgi:Ca-activated chloride channel family protein
MYREFSACQLLAAAVMALSFLGCAGTTPVVDPGAIRATGQLATPLVLVGDERSVYAVLRIEATPIAERQAGPVNLALCIDTSGSMEGAAIVEARRAAIQMVNALKDGDRLAVVTFNTNVQVVLPSTELDDDVRAEVTKAIADLKEVGTTDLAGGLRAAVAEVQANLQPDGVNRVVLLGDGVPNEASSITSIAQDAAMNKVAITTLGLGLDYDEVLMGKIAELSGGRFAYVKSADKLAGFFQAELSRMQTVYARNVSVTLTAGPGVSIQSVVGASYAGEGRVVHVTLGDIARGESRELFVRMNVTARKANAPIELLDSTISFAGPDVATYERRVYFGARASADEAKVLAAKNRKVELAAALAEAGATTLAALELAKQKQYVRAREMLTKGAEAARSQAKATPSAKLEKQAKDMVAVAEDMPATDPAPVPTPASSPAQGVQALPDVSLEEVPATTPESAARRKEVHHKSYQYSH